METGAYARHNRDTHVEMDTHARHSRDTHVEMGTHVRHRRIGWKHGILTGGKCCGIWDMEGMKRTGG